MELLEENNTFKDFLLKTEDEQENIAKIINPFITDIDRDITSYIGDLNGEITPLIWIIRELASTAKKKRKKQQKKIKRLFAAIHLHEPQQLLAKANRPITISPHTPHDMP
jgi:hypothetical protein